MVNARNEATVRLRLRGSSGSELEVDALVDTGFTGSLALPNSITSLLGLIRHGNGMLRLADGSQHPYDIYSADVEWDGSYCNVVVSQLGEEPMVGMDLLMGYELRIEVIPGGLVQAVKLP